jgi:hypothetical protein
VQRLTMLLEDGGAVGRRGGGTRSRPACGTAGSACPAQAGKTLGCGRALGSSSATQGGGRNGGRPLPAAAASLALAADGHRAVGAFAAPSTAARSPLQPSRPAPGRSAAKHARKLSLSDSLSSRRRAPEKLFPEEIGAKRAHPGPSPSKAAAAAAGGAAADGDAHK